MQEAAVQLRLSQHPKIAMILIKLYFLINLTVILFSFCYAADPKCDIGSFLSAGNCELCPPGTYQNKKGATDCIPCPPGFFNRFKGAPGIDICQPCNPGTFSTVKGAKSGTVCKPCPVGKSSPAGADRCISCPAGSFISKCPQGRTTSVQPNGRCLVCDQVYCDVAKAELKCRKCHASSFSPKKHSLRCTYCPGNMIAKEGSSKCNNCPPGQGNVLTGNELTGVCLLCRYYLVNDGSSGECSSCPGGFQGDKRVGATKCVPCPAGTGGFFDCSKCDVGQNTFVTGATFCAPDNTPCASNFFRNSRGACERCKQSHRYNKSKNKCEPCRKNELSKGGVDTECINCPPGEITLDVAITSKTFENVSVGRRCVCQDGTARTPNGKCGECPPGFYRQKSLYVSGDETDGDACIPCSRGTFAPRAGSLQCFLCPTGTFQPLDRQTKCLRCPPGTRSTDTECLDPLTGCPKDTKRVNEGLGFEFHCENVGEEVKRKPPCQVSERFVAKTNECVPCHFDSSSKGGRSTKCEKCDGIFWTEKDQCKCVGGYGDGREIVNGTCRVCPAGSSGTNGVTGCEPCPAGYFRSKFSGKGDECHYCDPGTFSKEGAAKCSRCPKGTDNFAYGSVNCV